MPIWKRSEMDNRLERNRDRTRDRHHQGGATSSSSSSSPSSSSPRRGRRGGDGYAPRQDSRFKRYTQRLSRTADYFHQKMNRMYYNAYNKEKPYGFCRIGCFRTRGSCLTFFICVWIVVLAIIGIIAYIFWPRMPSVEFSKVEFANKEQQIQMNMPGMGLLKELRYGTPMEDLKQNEEMMKQDFDPEMKLGFSMDFKMQVYMFSQNTYNTKLKHVKLKAHFMDVHGKPVPNMETKAEANNLYIIAQKNNTIPMNINLNYRPKEIKSVEHDPGVQVLLKACGGHISHRLRKEWHEILKERKALQKSDDNNDDNGDDKDKKEGKNKENDDDNDKNDKKDRNADDDDDDDNNKNEKEDDDGENEDKGRIRRKREDDDNASLMSSVSSQQQEPKRLQKRSFKRNYSYNRSSSRLRRHSSNSRNRIQREEKEEDSKADVNNEISYDDEPINNNNSNEFEERNKELDGENGKELEYSGKNEDEEKSKEDEESEEKKPYKKKHRRNKSKDRKHNKNKHHLRKKDDKKRHLKKHRLRKKHRMRHHNKTKNEHHLIMEYIIETELDGFYSKHEFHGKTEIPCKHIFTRD